MTDTARDKAAAKAETAAKAEAAQSAQADPAPAEEALDLRHEHGPVAAQTGDFRREDHPQDDSFFAARPEGALKTPTGAEVSPNLSASGVGSPLPNDGAEAPAAARAADSEPLPETRGTPRTRSRSGKH